MTKPEVESSISRSEWRRMRRDLKRAYREARQELKRDYRAQKAKLDDGCRHMHWGWWVIIVCVVISMLAFGPVAFAIALVPAVMLFSRI